MPSTSLYNEMESHYVDSDGNTISEAVDLGMTILQFLTDLHESIELATRHEDTTIGKIVCDYYLSLSAENFGRDSMDANSDLIKSQIELIKSKDMDIGLNVHSVTLGSFTDIVDNKFFNHKTCNILLTTLLIESVMRTCNAHIFCKSQEHNNVLIVYSNMQSSYHVIAMIAFLCNADQEKYFSMNLKVEEYANNIVSSLRYLIEGAAMEYR